MSEFSNSNYNMDLINNLNLTQEEIINNEVNEIKKIKILMLFQIIATLISTILSIYIMFTIIPVLKYGVSYFLYSLHDSQLAIIMSISSAVSVIILIAIIVLAIFILINSSKIKLIKLDKGLIKASAIVAICSFINIFALVSFAAFIISIVCYISLNKLLKYFENLKK